MTHIHVSLTHHTALIKGLDLVMLHVNLEMFVQERKFLSSKVVTSLSSRT